jgi:hypothetical protein
LAPVGVSHVQTSSGRQLGVPADRILELAESDAAPLLARSKFERVNWGNPRIHFCRSKKSNWMPWGDYMWANFFAAEKIPRWVEDYQLWVVGLSDVCCSDRYQTWVDPPASDAALDRFELTNTTHNPAEIVKARTALERIGCELEKFGDPNSDAVRLIKQSLGRPIDWSPAAATGRSDRFDELMGPTGGAALAKWGFAHERHSQNCSSPKRQQRRFRPDRFAACGTETCIGGTHKIGGDRWTGPIGWSCGAARSE